MFTRSIRINMVFAFLLLIFIYFLANVSYANLFFKIGMQESLELGQFIKERYRGFLSEDYVIDEVRNH